jgi:hypothetical protein
MNLHDQGLNEVLEARERVLATSEVLRFLSKSQLRWQITSGRWQKPSRGVIVAQSGPLTSAQLVRAALLRAGPAAVLAGLTAARLDGFQGFDNKRPLHEMPIYLLVPPGYRRHSPPPGLLVVTHYSRALTDDDVHPDRHPRRTRIARSLIDAAVWMPTDRGAMAILAAGVQQGLVRADDLRQVTSRIELPRRRTLIGAAIGDIAGGARSMSELDFLYQVVRAFGLPEPSRQAPRRDTRGRRRWIDVLWDDYKVAVEVDGAQHAGDPLQRWDDMERDIDLALDGYLTLRFPAWLVRDDPQYVARRVLEALRKAGYQG